MALPESGRVLDYPIWTADLVYDNSTGEFRVDILESNNVIYYEKIFIDRGPMVRVHDGRYTPASHVFKSRLDAMQATLKKLIDRQGKLKACVDRLTEAIAAEKSREETHGKD